jgi:hypothetical protein
VLVKSNSNPFRVIVSIDGRSDLRIDTTRALPRKLAYNEYVMLEEDLLFYEKTGKYDKMQILCSQSGGHFKVPIAAIMPLTPAPSQTPVPKPTVNPI